MALISDRDKQFFAPLWRRVALLAVLAGWTGFEFVFGDATWGWLAAGIGALAVWVFFLSFDPPKPETKTAKTDDDNGN